jgi:hypothetical protein
LRQLNADNLIVGLKKGASAPFFIASHMSEIKMKLRIRAALIHLAISTAIGLLTAVLVYLVWYPDKFSIAVNVSSIFIILLVVDICLGPLITFIIFNPKKKELKLDLAIVALIQMGALVYGVNTVFEGRPIYVVFNIDRFDLVRANDLSDEDLSLADKEFQARPLWGVRYIIAVRPESPDERQKLLFDALDGKKDLPFIPKYYQPYENHLEYIKTKIRSLDELKIFNPDMSMNIDALKQKYSGLAGYLPMRADSKDLTIILDFNSGQVVDVLELKPWQ